jgi:hypothetical protein
LIVASETDMDYGDLPTFLIDCRARQGQSGSPVIVHRNPGASYSTVDAVHMVTGGSITELFGIYSGRINDQSDLGLVWKVSAIKELLESLPTS